MEKIAVGLKISVFIFCCLAFFAFTSSDLLNDEAIFMQKKLVEHYDMDQEAAGLQRGELTVTITGFCRYKKFFGNGKIEYFSFNLVKFKDLDYLGTVKRGRLLLHTEADNVIVQTYNDKAGDLDSMASGLTIPLKNIDAEELVDFSRRLHLMQAALKK
jgi:hypothetical protein